MKLPYERPEAELTHFRAMEKLAFDEDAPWVDIDPTSEIGGDLGVEDWNWSGK